jgi:hypothetical protein
LPDFEIMMNRLERVLDAVDRPLYRGPEAAVINAASIASKNPTRELHS